MPRMKSHLVDDGIATFATLSGLPWAYANSHWTSSAPTGVDMSWLTSVSFDYEVVGSGVFYDFLIVNNLGMSFGRTPTALAAGSGTLVMTLQDLGATGVQLQSVERITLAFRQYTDAPASVRISNFRANGAIPAPGALAVGAAALLVRRRRRGNTTTPPCL